MADRNENRDTRGDVRGDVRGEIREFLSTRRAKISPPRPGCPPTAVTAGGSRACAARKSPSWPISSEYYTRLERGNATGVSDSVIDGIAHALHLDDAERTHLLDLLRSAGTTCPPRRRPAPTARPADGAAGPGLDGRYARVRAQRAPDLWPPTSSGSRCSRRSTATRPGRPTAPGSCSWIRRRPSSSVTGTRSPTTRSPCCVPRPAETPTTGLSELIGELSTRSEEFRVRWAAHHVRIHTSGVKRFHIRSPGTWSWRLSPSRWLPIPARASTYTAEPGSPSQDALRLLASWAATTDDIQQPAGTDDSEQAESFETPDCPGQPGRATTRRAAGWC